MPLINVTVIEGAFDPAPKRDIVKKLTEAMVDIEESMRPVSVCHVQEVRSGDDVIGGNPLTTADVKNLAAGQPAAVYRQAIPAECAARECGASRAPRGRRCAQQ